jgi:glycosyltransferase involved in cell wall biosynthesis
MSTNKLPTILFLNHWAKNMGGAEHSLLDIIAETAKTAQCHLITSEEGVFTQKAKQYGAICHVAPCKMKDRVFLRKNLFLFLFSFIDIISFLRYVYNIQKLAQNIQPQIIHANVPKSHIALCFLWFRGYKVFHMREIFPKLSFANIVYLVLFPLKKCSVISISQAVHNNLPFRLKSKSTVIYNGIAIPSNTKDFSNLKQAVRLLYLGRIVPWKGCHLLIDIFYEVKRMFPEHTLSLSLVGDSYYWSKDYRQNLLLQIKSHSLESCCSLLPHTDDIASVFLQHDIFVNASVNEPFGRSIAEAMAAGLAVVSFNTGGIGELVVHKETGLLVEDKNNTGFIEALCELIRDEDKIPEMGKKARIRAMELFNREIQIQRIVDFIKQKI